VLKRINELNWLCRGEVTRHFLSPFFNYQNQNKILRARWRKGLKSMDRLRYSKNKQYYLTLANVIYKINDFADIDGVYDILCLREIFCPLTLAMISECSLENKRDAKLTKPVPLAHYRFISEGFRAWLGMVVRHLMGHLHCICGSVYSCFLYRSW